MNIFTQINYKYLWARPPVSLLNLISFPPVVFLLPCHSLSKVSIGRFVTMWHYNQDEFLLVRKAWGVSSLSWVRWLEWWDEAGRGRAKVMSYLCDDSWKNQGLRSCWQKAEERCRQGVCMCTCALQLQRHIYILYELCPFLGLHTNVI